MKTTVQRAYLINGSNAARVLADSHGQVFLPGTGWTRASGTVHLVPGGNVYERWSDVPFAWVDAVPYW